MGLSSRRFPWGRDEPMSVTSNQRPQYAHVYNPSLVRRGQIEGKKIMKSNWLSDCRAICALTLLVVPGCMTDADEPAHAPPEMPTDIEVEDDSLQRALLSSDDEELYSARLTEGKNLWSEIAGPGGAATRTVPTSLTVTTPNGRTVFPGGSIRHEFLLKRGTTPLANRTIGVSDPIRRISAEVRTNDNGKASYTIRTNEGTKPAFHTFVFTAGTTRMTSTVGVRELGRVVVLRNIKLDLISIAERDIGTTTRVMSNRAPGAGVDQSAYATLFEAEKFGIEVLADYYSNPFNIAATIVTVAVCVPGQSVPAAGQIGCVAAVKYVGYGIAHTAVVSAAKRAIDESSLTRSQKREAKSFVEAGATVWELSRFRPEKGMEAISSAAMGWDFGTTVVTPVVRSGRTIGYSIAAQRQNSTEVVQMACYSR